MERMDYIFLANYNTYDTLHYTKIDFKKLKNMLH
jgi:hypothetical protein